MSQNETQTALSNDATATGARRPVMAAVAQWQPRVAAGLLGLPRTYWLLWAGMLLNRLGGGVFLFLALYLTRARGLAPALAGLVIGLYAAGGMIAGPVGGALADRAGRRTTLLAGTASAGALMLALGFARTTALIVLLAPLLGFCTDLCRPPLHAAVADLVPPAERKRAYGLIYWAINLGFAGAASLGGLLAERSFTLLFVLDALTTWLYGGVVLLGVPETRPAFPATRTHSARALLEPFADRRLLAFLGIQLPLLLSFAQVVVALPLDMGAHGLPARQIGLLMGLNGVIIVVAQPIALRLGARAGHVTWLALGAALTGAGLGALALAGGALVYALASVVWTLGEIGFATGTPALLAELAPVERRGAYQGTHQLAWGLSAMVAPTAGSLMLARLGSAALWLSCLALCSATAVLHLTVTRRNEGRARR